MEETSIDHIEHLNVKYRQTIFYIIVVYDGKRKLYTK